MMRCSYCDAENPAAPMPSPCPTCGRLLTDTFDEHTTLQQLAAFVGRAGTDCWLAMLPITPDVTGVILYRGDRGIWGINIRNDGLPLTEEDAAAIEAAVREPDTLGEST